MPRCVSVRRKSSWLKPIPLPKWRRTIPVLSVAKVAAGKTADFEKVVPEGAATAAEARAGPAGMARDAGRMGQAVPVAVRPAVHPSHGRSGAELARFTYSIQPQRRVK